MGGNPASVYVCCFGETVLTPGTQRRAGSRDLPLQSSGTYTWQPLEGEVTLSFVDCHLRVTLSPPNPSDLSSVRWESRGMHRQGVVRGSWEVLIPEVS